MSCYLGCNQQQRAAVTDRGYTLNDGRFNSEMPRAHATVVGSIWRT